MCFRRDALNQHQNLAENRVAAEAGWFAFKDSEGISMLLLCAWKPQDFYLDYEIFQGQTCGVHFCL